VGRDLVRLAGPVTEDTFAEGYWSEAADIVTARHILAHRFAGITFDQAWDAAERLVIQERRRIAAVAAALARLHRLDEPEFFAIVRG
jgi:hypothetical protein